MSPKGERGAINGGGQVRAAPTLDDDDDRNREKVEAIDTSINEQQMLKLLSGQLTFRQIAKRPWKMSADVGFWRQRYQQPSDIPEIRSTTQLAHQFIYGAEKKHKVQRALLRSIMATDLNGYI